jgi:hypothetical protein
VNLHDARDRSASTSSPRSRARQLLALALVMVAGSTLLPMLGACNGDGAPACSTALPEMVEDREVIAYLARLQRAHVAADAAEEASEWLRAADVLAAALNEVAASDAADEPASREARSDAWARVAELRLAAADSEGELAAAEQAIEAGLGAAPPESYLAGRLHEIRGAVELARARGGDEAARARARAAFTEAVRIQRREVGACSDSDALVVGPALVAYLSQAEAMHRLADLDEQEGDGDSAERQLAVLLATPSPSADGAEDAMLPEVREVRAETWARLAELESARGDIALARASLSQGLELAQERTLFRGRLMEVMGRVEERDAERLLAAGKADEAAKAKSRALDAYNEAVLIHKEAIERLLEALPP